MKISNVEADWLKTNINRIPFLKVLNSQQVSAVVEHITPRVLTGNQPIIKEGNKGEAFFLIYNGKVSVWVERDGKQAKLATLNRGDYFGEISLLTGRPAIANVIALAPTKVFFLNSAQLIALLRANPILAKQVQEVMRKRLEAQKKAVEDLVYGDLKEINKAIEDFLNS